MKELKKDILFLFPTLSLEEGGVGKIRIEEKKRFGRSLEDKTDPDVSGGGITCQSFGIEDQSRRF